MSIRPFTINIPDERLEDLRSRLRAVRWPKPVDGEGWSDGTDLQFLQRFTEYWLNRFDWRAQERRLNGLPQFMATVDGQEIHFVHVRGSGPAPLPLILTHGWPGSFAEMEQVIPLLADPQAHGGDPADAFHVVVPSLPGYGFSPAPKTKGVSSRRIADLWRGLMAKLGYARFALQGGDIGASVSVWTAKLFPQQVLGLHLNFIPGSYSPHLGHELPPISQEEQAYLDKVASWGAEEGAYAHLHSTRPQTLSYALTDSPVGLAAWLVEKFRNWSDCNGDVEQAFGFDTLLTDISLYWFGDDINGSLRLYKENRLAPLTFNPGERVAPPVGVALFPRELPMPPRTWVERAFDVRRWTVMPRGGHFAALEQPDLLVEDIRAFFRLSRAGA
ncbi:MAG TPA: epoxide hydrolase [Bryobacteraceae bacterium]|nr:epoxide hydrolase [Bryobacteraceae bacterium]